MTIELTRNDEELKAAFQRLETIFQAAANTPEADEMEVWVTLIEAYENKHYTIAPPDPIKVIKFRMEQQNLSAKDLESYIGSKRPSIGRSQPQASAEFKDDQTLA